MPECPACGHMSSQGESICTECGTDLSSMIPAQQQAVPDVPEPGGEPAVSPQDAVMNAAQAVDPLAAPVAEAPVNVIQPRAKLILLRGGELTSIEYPVGLNVQIGRFDPSTGPVDVDLGELPEATYVSRKHAELKCDTDGNWLIKDLGSNNGTYFKAAGESTFARIADEQAIVNDDEIAFGNVRFRFAVTE